MRPLFNSYDTDGSGKLDYREFAAAIFGQDSVAKGALVKKEVVTTMT